MKKSRRHTVARVSYSYNDATEEQTELNNAAAEMALRYGLIFMADPGSGWKYCGLECPSCSEHYWTRCAFFAKRPFGCPKCAPESEAAGYQESVDHPLRIDTLPEWIVAARVRLKKIAKILSKEESGPYWGLARKKTWDMKDVRRARDMMAPEEDLLDEC